eukprot:TRINITY_DN449_c0_g1_i2.p1 TRINITY_DN449_c0_g1~~TRINITY_DN449_c0_g1_i2.p1  ORF type:complete len:854 (+),score=213.92 TRINITY_DN449_c0_g1_i2:101-2662(+)
MTNTYKKKQELIDGEGEKAVREGLFVAFDRVPNRNGEKSFMLFPSCEEFEKYQKESKQKHFYECIFDEKTPVKPYFDVDFKASRDEHTLAFADEFMEKRFIPALQDYFRRHSGEELKLKNIVVFTSNTKEEKQAKYSYHVVVKRFYFSSAQQVKKLATQINKHLDGAHFVDLEPYHKFQTFRVEHSTKVGQARIKRRFKPKKYGKGAQFKHGLITVIGKKDKLIRDYPDYSKKKITERVEDIQLGEPNDFHKRYLDLVPYEGYGQWIAVGMALKNTFKYDDALNMWKEWSKAKCGSEYNAGELEEKFCTFRVDAEGKRFGTISFMAKEKDEKAWAEIKHDEEYSKSLRFIEERLKKEKIEEDKGKEEVEDDFEEEQEMSETEKIPPFNSVEVYAIIDRYQNDKGMVEKEEDMLEELWTYFNRYFIYTKVGNKNAFLREHDIDGLTMFSEETMKTDLRHYKITYFVVGSKKETKLDLWQWFEDNHRRWRKAHGIEFQPNPSKQRDGFHNIYQGRNYSHDDVKNVSLDGSEYFLNHLKHIWCGDDEEIYDFLMDLLAIKFQQPWMRIPAIVITSDKGAGKGIVINKYLELFNESETAIIHDTAKILDRFNSTMEGKLVIYLNEATFGKTKAETSRLRGYITEPKITIEKKGIDPYEIHNFCGFFIDGNYDDIVNLEGKERRYFVMKALDEMAGIPTRETREYFKKVSQISLEQLARILYERDVSDFAPEIIPQTHAMLELKKSGFNPIQNFVFDLIEDDWRYFGKRISKNVMYSLYKDSKYGRFTATSSVFWKELRNYLEFEEKQIKRSDDTRERVVVFADVETQKEKFCEKMGEIKWTEKPEEIEDDSTSDSDE